MALAIKIKSEQINTGQQSIVNIPDWGPWANFKDGMWLKFTPLKLESQSTGNRGGGLTYSRNTEFPVYRFLAPDNILENLAHQWQEYESIQKRAAEKLIALTKTMQEIRALGKGAAAGAKEMFSAKGKMSNVLARTVGGMTEGIPAYKLDAPLVYVNSTRRQYSFTFTIVAVGKKSDFSGMVDIDAQDQTEIIYQQLTKVIKDFERMSSPSSTDSSGKSMGFLSISLPYIFTVVSEGGEGNNNLKPLINITHAACTAVQTQFKAPYIGGYPMQCDLTLTFEDISPLMRETIERGTIITSREKGTGGASTKF